MTAKELINLLSSPTVPADAEVMIHLDHKTLNAQFEIDAVSADGAEDLGFVLFCIGNTEY